MHGGLSPALRPRQAGAPNVRGPSRPRREPTAITKDESRLQQKLLKNKIVPLLFKHTYALKPEKKKQSNHALHRHTRRRTDDSRPEGLGTQVVVVVRKRAHKHKQSRSLVVLVGESDVLKTASVRATAGKLRSWQLRG